MLNAAADGSRTGQGIGCSEEGGPKILAPGTRFKIYSLRFPISCRLGQRHGLQNITLTNVFLLKYKLTFNTFILL
jgi:hypothetical protein